MLQFAALSLSSQAQVNQSATPDEEEEIASPKDSARRKIVKLPPLPSIPKKVLSAQDSIAQMNHHSSRYIFAPSAYPIRKGSFYYQNYDLLLNDIQVGITDNFGIGIGYAFPLFMYVTPKYSMPLQKNHTVAVGDIAAFSVFTKASNTMWLNTLYGMYTLGSTKNNISLGLGILQSSDLDGNHAVTNLSGMYSITPNFYFVGEAWFNNRVRQFTSSYTDYVYDATKMDYSPVTKPVNEKLNRSTLFTSLQFRIIGHKQRTTAWSFGVSSYWERGDQYAYNATVPVWDKTPGQVSYENQSFVMGPTNKFYFIPSFTYVKKIGDM
ncbi:MAG: hypothetical protein RL411_1172, partial [Bacteroidota bacterium]